MYSVKTYLLPIYRAVVSGVADFGHFQGKSCKMLHLKYDFPLFLSLCYPGFKNLSAALPHYSIVTPMMKKKLYYLHYLYYLLLFILYRAGTCEEQLEIDICHPEVYLYM